MDGPLSRVDGKVGFLSSARIAGCAGVHCMSGVLHISKGLCPMFGSWAQAQPPPDAH